MKENDKYPFDTALEKRGMYIPGKTKDALIWTADTLRFCRHIAKQELGDERPEIVISICQIVERHLDSINRSRS